MIKPTPGRIVNVWPARTWPGAHSHHHRKQPLAGFICHVWSDTMINISYADVNGVWHPMTSVYLAQPDSEDIHRPKEGYAEWMDYQVGQAAKHDQIAQALASAQEDLAAYKANFGPLPPDGPGTPMTITDTTREVVASEKDDVAQDMNYGVGEQHDRALSSSYERIADTGVGEQNAASSEFVQQEADLAAAADDNKPIADEGALT